MGLGLKTMDNIHHILIFAYYLRISSKSHSTITDNKESCINSTILQCFFTIKGIKNNKEYKGKNLYTENSRILKQFSHWLDIITSLTPLNKYAIYS